MGKIICRLAGVTYNGRQEIIKRLSELGHLKEGTMAQAEYFHYNHVPACRVLFMKEDIGNIPSNSKGHNWVIETLQNGEVIKEAKILSVDQGPEGIYGIGVELTIEKGEVKFNDEL